MPSLTVVTITIGPTTDFHRTRRSLRDQVSQDFEWIVVNGGEPIHDSSMRAIGSDTRLVEQSPVGIYHAMNLGLRHAQGSSISFLNAGDSYMAQAVTELRLLASRSCWGYGAIQLRTSGDAQVQRYDFAPFARLLLDLGLRYVPHPASTVNTDLLRFLGGFSTDPRFNVSSDQLTFMRLARIAPPARSARVIATHYLGGASSFRTPKAVASEYQHMRQLLSAQFFGNEATDRAATALVSFARGIRRKIGNASPEALDGA